MFLIRSAFWLAVVVAVLPSDPKDQAQLYQTASSAMHRAATFCDRNEAICTEAQRHFTTFKGKLAIAGRMAGDLINERLAGAEQPVAEPVVARPAVDTLSAADRKPTWRVDHQRRL